MTKKMMLLFTATLLVISAACSDADNGGEANVEDGDPVSYYGQVQPLVNEYCAGCHYPGEGAPIDLHTFDDVSATAELSLQYMDSGEMPPWPPDPECREYQDQRVMPDEAVETFRQWIEDGKLAGDDSDMSEFAPELPEEPDIRAGIFDAPYEPRADISDEYRCFLLDHTFDEDTYVTANHVETGGAEVIHHANIFLVNPFQIETVEALEASESDAGYPCFGDPGFSSIDLIGAWVPGAQPIEVPDDSAVIIPAGSRLVMQTHFNTVFAEPEPVSPEVTLYTRDDPPDFRVRGMPFANMDFVIPPGESESVHTEEYQNRTDRTWHVMGVAPHLHDLASRVEIDIIHEDSSQSCLIDVPDWDFNWQQAYRFLDDDWVEVEPGDKVRMTCVFDNSPANQPIIDGEQQQPREVTWGGRTVDEMCMTFLVVSEPYEPKDGDALLCDEFNECHTECDDPFDIGCIFNCGSLDNDCGICLITGAQTCGNQYCPQELNDATPCLVNCALGAQGGGDIDGCLTDDCPDERDDLEECIRPRIEGGMCNEYLTECNIEF